MTDEADRPSALPGDTPGEPLSPEAEYVRMLEARLRAGASASDILAGGMGDEPARPEPVCCRFHRAGREYHVPVEYVLEIGEMRRLTRLPLAPDFLVGLINLRGECVPVIDLGRLYMGRSAPPVAEAEARLLIVDAGAETLAFLSEGNPYLSPEAEGEAIEVVDFVRQHRVGAPEG